MDDKRFSEKIFGELDMKEILEIRKQDLFILLITAKSWLKLVGSSEKEIAKILAVIFTENNWKERIINEFCEFVENMGEKYNEQHTENTLN